MSHKRRLPNERIRRGRQLVSTESVMSAELAPAFEDSQLVAIGSHQQESTSAGTELATPVVDVREAQNGVHEVIVDDQVMATCVNGIGARALTTMCEFTIR